MKSRLLLCVATGAVVASASAAFVMACEDAKTSATAAAATSSKSAACTPAMAAQCTPAQAAACKSKTKVSAVTASNVDDCCAAKGAKAKATAVNASAKSKNAACASKSFSTVTSGACKSHGVSAVTAVAGDDEAITMPAGSGHACNTSKGVKATAAGNGYSCGGKGVTAMAGRSNHSGCDACADMSDCDGELRSSGALTQVVKLKNGIMYVYTAQEPGKVRAVQAAVAQRNDRLVAITASGDKAKLCPDCKVMRGAVASGKLTREMVTIEGGCMTLVTSTDRAIVGKLHAMVSHHNSHAKI